MYKAMRSMLVLAVFGILSASEAKAQYGPGFPTSDSSYQVKVPKGKTVTFSFSAGGAWENMIVITADSGDGLPRLVTSKGNHGRDTRQYTISAKGTDVTYTIAGWHKAGGPDGKKPWLRSRVKILDSRQGSFYQIGWDDSAGDRNYRDAICWVVIQ